LQLEYDLSISFMRAHEKVPEALTLLLSDLQQESPHAWIKVVTEVEEQYAKAS